MILERNQIFSHHDAYRFIKVEQYFRRYKEWERLGKVVSYKVRQVDNQTITLNFQTSVGESSLLINFPQQDAVRIRFNPKKQANDYSKFSTQINICNEPEKKPCLYVDSSIPNELNIIPIRINVERHQIIPIMKVKISLTNFKISIYRINLKHSLKEQKYILEKIQSARYDLDKLAKILQNEEFRKVMKEKFKQIQQEYLVWSTSEDGILFTKNGNEHAIIQSVNKISSTYYVGFGEQGGQSLVRDNQQLNYFNFDNYRARQVYNSGPLDFRQPLYHSEPVFYQFNAAPGKNNVNGIFVNNQGQILMDIGFINSSRYMFGTRFEDLDYYVLIGEDTSRVIQSLTEIIGRPELKPRYALGYHQGCYGYQNRGDLEWVAKKHRDYGIPLDGIHIDVDIQKEYQTFTINQQKFNNPKEMFQQLRKKGIKCCTNITPIIKIKNGYSTYEEGIRNKYFVLDSREGGEIEENYKYEVYQTGRLNTYQFNEGARRHYGFNSGNQYIGEVNYGNGKDDRGNIVELKAQGHYPDFARKDVRSWWGTQYKNIFDAGIEFIWQDMTTPAVATVKGDMKSFPYKLLVSTNVNTENENDVRKVPFISVWNEYSFNLHKATYEGLRQLESRKNLRNFIIGRGSFTGLNKYAGLWTGDNASEWAFLKINISQVLSLGLSGVLISGQDIGGFTKSYESEKWTGPELMIRWITAGAFLPWFRNHYMRKGVKQFQQVYMFEQWFNQRGRPIPQPRQLYKLVLPACKYYIQLRYRLLQLFYDSMFKNLFTGLPICRPLFLNFPHDMTLFNSKISFLSNQFFVGNDLLVAPVVDPQIDSEGNNNEGKRDIYLPLSCGWYTFKDNKQPLGQMYEGGTTISDYDAGLYSGNQGHIPFIVPLFVRQGGIIPTLELQQWVGQKNSKNLPNPITLNIYPGNSGTYNLFLDDGVSYDSQPFSSQWNGYNPEDMKKYRQLKIRHTYSPKNQRKIRKIYIQRKNDNYRPLQKFYFVAILHDPNQNTLSQITLRTKQLHGLHQFAPVCHSDNEDQQQRINCQNLISFKPQKQHKHTLQTPQKQRQQLQQIDETILETRLPKIQARSDNQAANLLYNSVHEYGSWYYNRSIRISFIKVNDDPGFKKLVLTLTYNTN